MPTDTIYGLVGSALDKKTVRRIYRIRTRSPKKPCIILIASPRELRRFGIILNTWQKKQTEKFWPGPVSIVLPVPSRKFRYLHRDRKTLAFRVPQKPSLRKLLAKTGPLIAPSANPEGFPPAQNLYEAKKYFGKNVDFYVPGRVLTRKPSRVIYVQGGKTRVLRP